MTQTLNPDLLLRAVHAVENGRLDHNDLARELDVNRTTLLRLRIFASTVFGIEFARAKEVRVLYIADFGVFDPVKLRKQAATLVRARQPGAHRKAMITRKVTP